MELFPSQDAFAVYIGQNLLTYNAPAVVYKVAKDMDDNSNAEIVLSYWRTFGVRILKELKTAISLIYDVHVKRLIELDR